MNQELSNKIKFFSFFLILLVVFIHSENLLVKFSTGNYIAQSYSINSFLQNFISNGLCRIAVPIFFVISGYLFFLKIEFTPKGYVKKYKSRFYSLVIPYLIWSFYGILLYYLLQLLPFTHKFFTHNVMDYGIKEFIDSLLVHPITHQLWFVRDLILLVFFSPVFAILLKKAGIPFLSLIFICWYFRLNYYLLSFESIFFFSLGSYFSIRKISLEFLKLRQYSIVSLIFWILVLLIKTFILIRGWSNANWDSILLKTSILFGIVGVWTYYDKLFLGVDIRMRKWWSVLSYSFIIYVFHDPLLTILQKGMFYISGYSQLASIVIYFSTPIMSVIISVLLGVILSERAHKMYKYLIGNR
jgi:surface polysaccharide O-acyltransferase-like enzyme